MEAIRSFLYVDRTLKCPLFLFFFYLGLSLMQSTFYSFFNYSENQIIWTSEGWVVKTASMRSTLKINKEKKLFVFLNHYSVKKKIHVFQLQNWNFSPYFFFFFYKVHFQSDPPPLLRTLVRVWQVSIGGHFYMTFTSDQSGEGFNCIRKIYKFIGILRKEIKTLPCRV